MHMMSDSPLIRFNEETPPAKAPQNVSLGEAMVAAEVVRRALEARDTMHAAMNDEIEDVRPSPATEAANRIERYLQALDDQLVSFSFDTLADEDRVEDPAGDHPDPQDPEHSGCQHEGARCDVELGYTGDTMLDDEALYALPEPISDTAMARQQLVARLPEDVQARTSFSAKWNKWRAYLTREGDTYSLAMDEGDTELDAIENMMARLDSDLILNASLRL